MNNNKKNIDKETFLAKWLDGQISDAEFKKSVSNEDFIAYKKIKKGIQAFDVLEKPLDDSFKEIENRIQDKNTSKVIDLYKKWVFSIAGVLLLFIGINYFFKSNTVTYSTGIGEQKTIAMTDGSEIILNANSTVYFNKDTYVKNRMVFLKGEAFFKINKGNPFVVKTKNGDVHVLGTEFTVTSLSDYFQVKCFFGKVKVIQKNIKKILTTSQVYRKINGNSVEITQINSDTPYWLKGETDFKNTPVKYVFKALENQYPIAIERTNLPKTVLFTGAFPNKNQKVALDIVSEALQLNYKIVNQKVIFEKK